MKSQSRYSALILFFLLFSCLSGQNQATKWYFGKKAGLDFMMCPPSVLSSSVMSANEGCSSIADASGNFLFYCNGNTIYNQFDQVMANGSGLLADPSCSQAALIVKKPGINPFYYVFTLGYSQGFHHSIVDMSLAAGVGSVTLLNAPVYTLNCMEKLAATRHCNGVDIWVVIHEVGSNNFRSYLLTSAGLSTIPIISSVGYSYPTLFNPNLFPGCLKFSANGKKAGVTMQNAGLELFDFDNSSGMFSNSLNFNVSSAAPNGTIYDCEFSPDGTKLYCATQAPLNNTLQWDLCAGSNTAVLSSQYTVSSAPLAASNLQMGMQRGPNGKIYISAYSQQFLGVINEPNQPGFACNYVKQGQSIGTGTCLSGLPNFVSSLVKSQLSYTQNLSCPTVSFSPPATVYQGTAGCSNVVNIVTGYSWQFGDPSSGPANFSTLNYPVHNYPGFGNYALSLVINYAACAADTIKQTLSLSNPVITISQSSVSCNGLTTATTNLADGCSNASYSYTWSPGAQTNSIASNLSAGIYTVNVMSNGGSCISTVTTNISIPVNSVSAVVTNTLSCSTATAQIALINGSGNYSYSWNPGTQTASILSGLAPGLYTVTALDMGIQCLITKTLQIISYPTPTLLVTGNFTVCKGERVVLTVNGASTYQWDTNAVTASISATPTANIFYTVTGTNTLGLCKATNTVSILVNPCTDINEKVNASTVIKIYPNPYINQVTIETIQNIELRIFNQVGELVQEGAYEKGEWILNLEKLSPGVYYIRVFAGEDISSYRLVKAE